MASSGLESKRLKPIYLYDHLPGILAGYPSLLFGILALLQLPHELAKREGGEGWLRLQVLSPDAIFWVGISAAIVWYVAFRFNLPKKRFWLVFGLLGTFVGIPVILEITGYIEPFRWIGRALGTLRPSASPGAWLVGSMVFGVIWISNLIWSRTHLRVRLDETGLTIRRLGGKGERFDLIGLKTEDEPLDYLESFIAGVGSLSLKTRMNKPIFTMKRVIGLYRTPILPFWKGKLARIDEMLSYQGKVLSVNTDERVELSEALDGMEDDVDIDDDVLSEDDHEIDGSPADDDGEIQTVDSPDVK